MGLEKGRYQKTISIWDVDMEKNRKDKLDGAVEHWENVDVLLFFWLIFLNTIFVSKPYVPRTPKGPSRLYEHGIYIRHCQGSNSQPVPSQAGADPTIPQWRTKEEKSSINTIRRRQQNWIGHIIATTISRQHWVARFSIHIRRPCPAINN